MDKGNWRKVKCKFKDKPIKYVYPEQDDIKKSFSEFILPYLSEHPFFKKVWVWGSLSSGSFGIYEVPYVNQDGSDLDLLVEVDEKFEIPKEFKEMKGWTDKRTYSRAFNSSLRFVYAMGDESTPHHLDFICHWPSVHTKNGFYSKVEDSFLIYERG